MRLFAIIILLVIFPKLILASAWNRKQGKGYSQLSFTYLRYDHLLNGDDAPIGLKRTISDFTYQFYQEYGFTDRFNLLLSLPYKYVSSSSNLNMVEDDPYVGDTLDSGSLQGLANLGIGIRISLFEKKYAMAFQFYLHNRMHRYVPSTGLRIGYAAWLFTPALSIGRGWKKTYIQAEAGAQFNSSNYSNNFIGNIEFGLTFWEDRSTIIFRTDVKLPFTTGTFDEGNSVQTGLYRDNSSYISPGLKLNQKIFEHWYFNVAGYGAIYSKNEGAAATLNFGLAYEW